jgi:hypothetical protein
MTNKQSTINSLNGKRINAIAFVMDYVELHFDGPILRCLANPTISHNNICITFPNHGSRDLLCSLIGEEVATIGFTDNFFYLKTTKGHSLEVILKPSEESGPEVLHYVPGEGMPIQVW